MAHKIYLVAMVTSICLTLHGCNALVHGGKLWRVQNLAEWQGKHHWWNKLWRTDDESLIKHTLKQFKYTPARNWSIPVHVMSDLVSDGCCRFAIESMIRGYHEYKSIWSEKRNWSAKLGNWDIHTIPMPLLLYKQFLDLV